MGKVEIQYCEGQFPHGCGQKLMDYPVFLHKADVRILMLLAIHYPRSVSTDQIGSILDKVKYTTVSHLKYFDLAEQGWPNEPGTVPEPVRGWWKATEQGIWFLTGEHKVPTKAMCFRGKRKYYEGKAKFIDEVGDFTGDHYQRVLEQWRPHDFTPDELPSPPESEPDDDPDESGHDKDPGE
jgi:hypothetical protein